MLWLSIRDGYVLHVSQCFFFVIPATSVIYTLSLHDALPIFHEQSGKTLLLVAERPVRVSAKAKIARSACPRSATETRTDRKSTRLNSSHRCISYAVFCLKKKTRETSTSLSHLVVRLRSCSRV